MLEFIYHEEADEASVVSLQLIEAQKELQKQIVATVANPVGKEGRRLEGFAFIHDSLWLLFGR